MNEAASSPSGGLGGGLVMKRRRSGPARIATRLAPYISTHIAMPMPPPTQRVARPFFALRLFIS